MYKMPALFSDVFSSDFSNFPVKTTPFDDTACRKRLINRITTVPGFNNCRILYIGDGPTVVLRSFPAQFKGKDITVVIRPITSGNKQVNEEINPLFTDSQKDQRFYSELVNAGFSCGAMFISGWVALFGVAAAPISGGTSLLITATATAAAGATAIQCGNSVFRLYNESSSEENIETNIWLDSQEWYIWTNYFLDTVSVIGAAGALKGILKTAQITQKAGTNIPKILKSLDVKSKRKLTIKILRYQNPKLSNNKIHLLMRAKKYLKATALSI